MNKKCIRCCEIKPLDLFQKDKQRPDGLCAYCKQCRAELRLERFAKNPNLRVNKQNYYYKKKFGMSKEEILALLNSQDNKCKLCGKELTLDTKETHVDHNHTTGNVRGVLCYRCNLMTGFIENKRYLLIKITEYLTQHTDNQ